MKDYYQILSIPDNSSQESIKKAFRKLAFQYHPDTNPGREKPAEDKFKEINEAYGVLGDKEKRRQYDLARKGLFTGAGFESGYSQQDIFRDTFTNQTRFEEMNRMFAQAGLRFDQDFLNRVFFAGSGTIFQFFTNPGGAYRPGDRTTYQQYHSPVSAYQPNFIERFLSRIVAKAGRYVLNKLFGLQNQSLPGQNLDYHTELEISSVEAASGGEKQVTYQRDGQAKKLIVKVPPGVKAGTRIRLKSMGMSAGGKSGDLYLHIKIKGQTSL
ncbi:DnaJ domain-containing protein [Chloroflexota bacterium]